MKRSQLLAGLLLAATTARAQSTSDGGRIVGGELASMGSAPWLVELRLPDTDPDHGDAPRWDQAKLARAPDWRWAHFCGGVLVTPAWVLTAAHCVPNDRFGLKLKVRLGTQVLSEPGWTYRIDNIVRHSDYESERGPSDIALVHIVRDPSPKDLGGEPRLNPIAVAGLSRSAATFAVRDYVWGWGATVGAPSLAGKTDALPLVSEALMQARQIPVDVVLCKAAYPADDITGGMFCATGDTPGKDSCGGDSGGPLTQGMGSGALLIGLVSFGDVVCGTKPGVYTDVAFYKDFIHDTLGPDVRGIAR